MVYRFLLLSDEIDDFKREITIDSEATFKDFNDIILDSVAYTKDQITSFFICEDDWTRRAEITLVDMDTSSEEDSYVMEKTRLDEMLEDEGQKLMFVFDQLKERAFYIELREIIPGKKQKHPKCTKSIGNPPVQIDNSPDQDTSSSADSSLDENFYGDEDFNIDELDEDGFENLDNLTDR